MSNKELLAKMLRASQMIANQSKRGPANYIIVNSSLSNFLLPLNQRRILKIEKILR
jgi:hypothetical protein